MAGGGAVKRCGREVLHERHGDCDGRTPNEVLDGQLTVNELRAALDWEQGRALVAVTIDGATFPLQLVRGRKKGMPVFMLGVWKP